MKNRKGNLLMTLGLLLLLAAVALVGYNQWDSNRAGEESEEALRALELIRFQQRLDAQQTAVPPVPVTNAPTTTAPATDAPTTTAPAMDASATTAPLTDEPAATAIPTATAPDARTTQLPREDAPATSTPRPNPTTAPATATTRPNPATAPATATTRPNPTTESPATATTRPNPTTESPLPTDMPTDTPTDTPAPTAEPMPSLSPVPISTGALYERVPGIEMPGQQVGSHEYIGTLSIPALGLELPIQRNWSYPNLGVSPCRYSGSAYRGEFVIIAHTYPTHFGKLNALSIGDVVTFTDMDGNVFRYVVRDKETISPDAADELAHSGYDLTLATCTLSGSKRLAVYCERQK